MSKKDFENMSQKEIEDDVGEGLIELVNPKIVSEKGEQTDLEANESAAGVQRK